MSPREPQLFDELFLDSLPRIEKVDPVPVLEHVAPDDVARLGRAQDGRVQIATRRHLDLDHDVRSHVQGLEVVEVAVGHPLEASPGDDEHTAFRRESAVSVPLDARKEEPGQRETGIVNRHDGFRDLIPKSRDPYLGLFADEIELELVRSLFCDKQRLLRLLTHPGEGS